LLHDKEFIGVIIKHNWLNYDVKNIDRINYKLQQIDAIQMDLGLKASTCKDLHIPCLCNVALHTAVDLISER